MKKRIFSFFLAFALLLGSVSETALAVELNSETEIKNEYTDSVEQVMLDEMLSLDGENGEDTEQENIEEAEQENIEDIQQENTEDVENIVNQEIEELDGSEDEDIEEPLVESDVKNDGTFSLKITGVEINEDSEIIQAAVWNVSASNGVYWYEAEVQEDGSYKVDGNIKNHGYHLGKYIVHIYTKDVENKLSYVIDGEFSTNSLSAGDFYEMSVENKYSKRLALDWIVDQGITDKVSFAVWSVMGGQDDLVWYEATKDGESYYADVQLSNHNTLGIYNAHAYILGKDGKKHILKGITFKVNELPEVDIQIVDTDEENGRFEADLYVNKPQSDISKVLVAVWPEAYPNSIHWYEAEGNSDGTYSIKADVKNHGYHIGKYHLHAYVKDIQGNQTYIDSTNITLKVSGGDFHEAEAENQYSKKLILESVVDQGIMDKVSFAVWSAEGGQDDLVWYEATYENGVYYANVVLANHNIKGAYHAHAYIVGKDGLKHILKGITFKVDELPEADIEIVGSDVSKGQFEAKLYVNIPQSDISKVLVAVWPEAYPNSIYWYQAEQNDDGTYSIKADVKNHGYHIGKYHLHGYVTNNQGKQIYIDATNITLNVSAEDLYVSGEDQYSVQLTLSGLQSQGITNKIQIAVWSVSNGSSDLYWHEATGQGDTYTADIMLFRHKGVGTYCADAYLIGKDGQSNFLKRLMFTVDELPQNTIDVVEVDNSKGRFTVEMSLNRPQEYVDTLYLPVWPTTNPDSVYWYKAERQADGKYLVNVDIKNHKYNTGVYNLHGYIQYDGQMTFIKAATYTLQVSADSFYKLDTDNPNIKTIIFSNQKNEVASGNVLFAVWSEANGQDDVVWYNATKQGQRYVSNVLLYNHNALGDYIVDAYFKDEKGQLKYLDEFTFNFDVAEMPGDEIEIGEADKNAGTFDVSVYLTKKWQNSQQVVVAVWPQTKPNAVYWYPAEKQNDGGYQIKVDAMKHQWTSGRYIIHVYATNKDGDNEFVEDAYTNLSLGTKVLVETLDTRSSYIKIWGVRNDAANVRFPAWSLSNGQDDVVWYNGEKNSDGSWGVTIHSKNHANAGDYMCHIYVDVEGASSYVVDRAQFNIVEKWENTWRWIDGYKRYINSNGEIDTDVSRLVKGPYLIKVYKWSNYLIIFAKDENGQFNVPVKAMITSCGNATPTGTFYTPQRWRWQTMFGGSQAQWVTQITGDFLLHSVPYRQRNNTTLNVTNMYNHLGETRSAGCVRLQAGSAKWIYDNCELRTKVIITATESGGPIAKPSFTPVPSWHTWDPTDPTAQYLCHKNGCH